MTFRQHLVRRIDRLIMIWTVVMFFCLDLDRSNLSQANTDDFLQDLHMTTDDFNLGNTLFRVRLNLVLLLSACEADALESCVSCSQNFRPSSSPRRLDQISGFHVRYPISSAHAMGYSLVLIVVDI